MAVSIIDGKYGVGKSVKTTDLSNPCHQVYQKTSSRDLDRNHSLEGDMYFLHRMIYSTTIPECHDGSLCNKPYIGIPVYSKH